MTATPVRLLAADAGDESGAEEATRDWDAAIVRLMEKRFSGVDAMGQMTDEMLEGLARAPHITTLRLGGSRGVTDKGVRLLARMPHLRHLDLSGTAITDRGLEILQELRALESLSLAGTRVTDAGVVHLSGWEQLQRIDLSMTETGDGALRALAGKQQLHDVKTGNRITDDGLPVLHDFPVFKTWRDGETKLALLSPHAEPNFLSLRGTFTDRGLAGLVGLDGLFALNVADRQLAITAAGLAPLVKLTHLGLLAFDATDESMPYVAAMPRLRFLVCQDTAAGDDGFVALSGSQSIEYIWGRRCYNLRSRGFTALARMPLLRGLSVSCKNVDDTGLAALPRFPALRELMPMDVPDEGYRHIGRCAQLESLLLMYCRDTSDVATSHLTGLTRLTRYFNSYTRITDRTPELLSGISSLERIELSACPGVTNAGVAALARLPHLRELQLSGMQNVTREALAAFPAHVRVQYQP
jgi:hypothetical protein